MGMQAKSVEPKKKWAHPRLQKVTISDVTAATKSPYTHSDGSRSYS
jgi:hypothetical protein